MFSRLFTASFLALLLVACTATKDQPKIEQSAVIDAARLYVKQNLSDDQRVLKYDALVIDREEHWVVVFMPPGEAVTGGVPEIYVDKETLKIKKIGRPM